MSITGPPEENRSLLLKWPPRVDSTIRGFARNANEGARGKSDVSAREAPRVGPTIPWSARTASSSVPERQSRVSAEGTPHFAPKCT